MHRNLRRRLPIKFNNDSFQKFFEARSQVSFADRTDDNVIESTLIKIVEFKEYYRYLKQLRIGNRNLNDIKEKYEAIITRLFNKCKKEPKSINIMEKDRIFFKGHRIDFDKDTLYKTMTRIVNNTSTQYKDRQNNIENTSLPNHIRNNHIIYHGRDININYNEFKRYFLTLRQNYGGIAWNKIDSFTLKAGSRKTRKNRVVNNKTRKRK